MSVVPQPTNLKQLTDISDIIVVAKLTKVEPKKSEIQITEVLYDSSEKISPGKTVSILPANYKMFQQISKAMEKGEPTPIPILPDYATSVSPEDYKAGKSFVFFFRAVDSTYELVTDKSYEHTSKLAEIKKHLKDASDLKTPGQGN